MSGESLKPATVLPWQRLTFVTKQLWGDILGPAQRLTMWETLAAIRLPATRQKGDKEAGLVVLSSDPLGINTEKFALCE